MAILRGTDGQIAMCSGLELICNHGFGDEECEWLHSYSKENRWEQLDEHRYNTRYFLEIPISTQMPKQQNNLVTNLKDIFTLKIMDIYKYLCIIVLHIFIVNYMVCFAVFEYLLWFDLTY